jgi:hypothetical protein
LGNFHPTRYDEAEGFLARYTANGDKVEEVYDERVPEAQKNAFYFVRASCKMDRLMIYLVYSE